MGSLHKGHISLIKRSLKECKKTIVSIFVNPTQFNSNYDFKNYPRNYTEDLSILEKLRVDFVYIPKESDVYNSKKDSLIKLQKKERILCAKYRKGHFEGVIQVMDRLTKFIKPQKVYMGEKDFQQLYLVKKYIQKKNDVKIISCKTIRDKNYLAFSSRNKLLSKSDLIKAGKISKEMISFKKNLVRIKDIKKIIIKKKNELTSSFNIKFDYIELVNFQNFKTSNRIKNSKLFVAYYIKKIRLIDNF